MKVGKKMAKLLLSFLSLTCTLVSAQPEGLFQPCEQGLHLNTVTCFFNDTIEDRLYIGGSFQGASDSSATSPGIVYWDGMDFHRVGCGFELPCDPPLVNAGGISPVLTITRWQDEIYAGGHFTTSAGNPVNHVARFDGNVWQPLGGGTDEAVVSLRPYGDGLYATGLFTQAGGVEAHGLARWDGTAWHSVYDLPDWSQPNAIFDAIYYQGDLYVGGNFGAPGGIRDIARYNGSEWVACGEGFIGQTSGVYQFTVHDSLLYVAGYLADWPPYGPETNPGSGVVTWNGSEWGRLGTGTRYSSNPTVYKMAWLRDTLYVGGIFTTIDGMPTGGLARWDGQAWCSLVPQQYFGNSWQRVGTFRDTLYVGGSFVTGGNDTLNRIAKWTGGWVDTCSVAVGLEELEAMGQGGITVYPNPVSDRLLLQHPNRALRGHTVRLFDGRGALVAIRPLGPGGQVDVSDLVAGIYTGRAHDADGMVIGHFRFLKL